MNLHTFMAILPLLLTLYSTTTITSRPTGLARRGLSTNCVPLFGGTLGCNSQWGFSSPNPFMSRPFLRSQTPPSSVVVVPSPPPPVFTNYPSFTPPFDDTNPSFTPPFDDTNPSFSPLVASPPPPGYYDPSFTPPLVPQLAPPTYNDNNDDNDDDDGGDTSGDSPFIGVSFSPPQPEVTLPPIVERNQPDQQFVSPPQENQPAPDYVFNNVSPPPLVPVDSQPPEDDSGKQLPQLPPVVESPPAA